MVDWRSRHDLMHGIWLWREREISGPVTVRHDLLTAERRATLRRQRVSYVWSAAGDVREVSRPSATGGWREMVGIAVCGALTREWDQLLSGRDDASTGMEGRVRMTGCETRREGGCGRAAYMTPVVVCTALRRRWAPGIARRIIF